MFPSLPHSLHQKMVKNGKNGKWRLVKKCFFLRRETTFPREENFHPAFLLLFNLLLTFLGWRCPGCQYVRLIFPREYRCFCGKVVDPVYERREIPHSCGEVCGKELKTAEGNVCVHKCVELCHPGPCPPCVANIMQ